MDGHNISTTKSTLEEVGRRFEQWRGNRKPSTAIPESLWEGAVSLCTDPSIYRVSRQLPLDNNQLKRRVGAVQPERGRRSEMPSFVELDCKPSLAEAEWLLEREDSDGGKRKMQIKGRLCLEPLELMRAFWGSDR